MAEVEPGQEEYDGQTYYPSAKVRLVVRFDEFGDPGVQAEAKKVFTKAPIKMTGTADKTAQLEATPDPDAPSGVNRLKLVPKSGPPGLAQTQDRSTDKQTFSVGGIIPKQANLGLNGVRQADTLSVTIKFIDLPIDPRVVRSCAIEFYLGTVSAHDFHRGVQGISRTATGEPLNVVPDKYVDNDGQQRTNLRFQGWVDEWTVVWDEDNEPAVKLECRDNTTLLIEQEHPPKMFIDMKLPIDEAVAKYLANFPQFAGLSVEYRPANPDGGIPKLEDKLAKTAFRPNLGPVASKGGAATSGSKTSVWDYLTDVAGSIGHLIRMDGTVIVLQVARAYLGTEYTGRPDDPFNGRSAKRRAVAPSARRFIYGRNVSSMKISRKFAKSAPSNIEVRSYHAKRKNVLVARFPLAGDTVQGPQPGDGKEQKWRVFTVSGIDDPKTLRIIAQTVHESISRNELTVGIRTRNLASFGGANLDPDLLDMHPGDTVELYVNRDEDETNTTNKIETLLLAQQRLREFMAALGYEGEFADAYAKAYTASGFQTAFKVRTLGFDWSIEDGVVVDVQAINYITVRLEKNKLPAGEEQTPK